MNLDPHRTSKKNNYGRYGGGPSWFFWCSGFLFVFSIYGFLLVFSIYAAYETIYALFLEHVRVVGLKIGWNQSRLALMKEFMPRFCFSWSTFSCYEIKNRLNSIEICSDGRIQANINENYVCVFMAETACARRRPLAASQISGVLVLLAILLQ